MKLNVVILFNPIIYDWNGVLEYLLAQPSQTAVCITRLTVIHGDESTRRRLTRLSRLDPKLASKLSQLSQLLPQSSIPDLDMLGEDSVSVLYRYCYVE